MSTIGKTSFVHCLSAEPHFKRSELMMILLCSRPVIISVHYTDITNRFIAFSLNPKLVTSHTLKIYCTARTTSKKAPLNTSGGVLKKCVASNWCYFFCFVWWIWLFNYDTNAPKLHSFLKACLGSCVFVIRELKWRWHNAPQSIFSMSTCRNIFF